MDEKIEDTDIKVKHVIVYGLVTYFGHRALKYVWWKLNNKITVEKGRRVREERDKRTYEFKSVPNEEAIANMSVGELKELLLKGEVTSVDLVNVFGKRCYVIGRALCLTTEECFDEAFIEAELKDKERIEAIKEGKAHLLPPLHGIPISVKDLVIIIF